MTDYSKKKSFASLRGARNERRGNPKNKTNSEVLKAGVIVFPGTNCDRDTFEACKEFGWDAEYVWHDNPTSLVLAPSPLGGEGWGEGGEALQSNNPLNKFDVIFLPGGFSYGDYVRSGALAKFSPVIKAVKDYIENKRGFVVGICNGFQILCEAGILPGALTHNENLKFICKDVELNSLFTPHSSRLTLPIANAEGRYVADEKTIQELKEKDMIFLTYKDNPNGSVENIAGLYDKECRIIGMMPHPERAFFKELGNEDGKEIFKIIEKGLI